MLTASDSRTVPRVRTRGDWRAFRLTPRQMYVLSRVDGKWTVEEIGLATGIGVQATLDTLRELAEIGLVRLGDDTRPIPAGAAGARAGAAPARPGAAGARGGAAVAQPGAAAQSAAAGARAAPVPRPAAPAPPEAVDLAEEPRRRIDEVYARLGHADAYEMLEVQPGADAKSIRQGYFRLSKEFHPDRHFGKRLGPYGERLQRVFAEINLAYELLSDDERRAAYEKEVVVERHAQEQARFSAGGHALVPEAFGARTAAAAAAHGAGPPAPARAAAATGPGPAPRPVRRAAIPKRSTGEQRAIARARLQELRERRHRLGWVGTAPAAAAAPAEPPAEASYRKAMEELRRGDFVAAAASLALACRMAPDRAEWQARLGEVRAKADRLVAHAHARRAQIEQRAGRFEIAAAQWMRAAERGDDPAHARQAAACWRHAGRIDQAAACLEHALARHPGDAAAQADLDRLRAEAAAGRPRAPGVGPGR